MSRHAWTATSLVLGAIMLPMSTAFAHSDQLAELKRLSVDELLDVEVTSVSRREEDLRKAAAAIAVLTSEDLRRSGATSMPEALRLVPGLHVAQENSTTWGVSARGFSSVNSEKLLVLSDTRSIYTPLFSGVAWDVQDYLLADVERVEVIRGPGAALWGSNAVNGVVNITTRSARDTHGDYLEAGVGDVDRFWVGARHGGETAGGRHFRVFARYFDRDGTENPLATSEDEARLGHLGFRMDWGSAEAAGWTMQGDAYAGDMGQLAPVVEVLGRPGPQGQLTSKVSGGNLLARWRRPTGVDSDLQVRAYYDYTRRDDPSFLDTLHTFDVDVQHRLTALSRHEIVWGVSGRLTANSNQSGGLFVVEPQNSDDYLWSGFVQDQIALSDSLAITAGTKVERNDFSGFEVQPSIRAAWTPDPGHTLWMAVSRAVRVPTRFERDVNIDASDPAADPLFRLLGNRDFGAEKLIAYEAGYRWQASRGLLVDLALFNNDYDALASLEVGTPFLDGAGRTVIPVLNQNLGSGRTRGAELLVEWQPRDYWRVSATYSAIDLRLESSGLDLNRNAWLEGSTPRGMAGLRSSLTLRNFEVDAQFRHHTRIRRLMQDVSGAGLDAYSSLDVRLGWRATPDLQISLMGQNLLDDEHVEFGTPAARGALARAAWLKAEWRHE
ncbi:MAG TPA: TonB-dependent receptor [Steroidobacteraceae bacterium]|nr:TonB-dependent receptor [Steroidobacteraceae bacterium]